MSHWRYGRRRGVTPPQKILGLPLETQQGMIRGPAPLDRVVADLCPLLLAVEDEDGRVDIEDQSRRPVWPHCHAPQQAIVQLPQLGERRWRHAQQESPQRGRIRIGVESREVLEHAVLSQQLGRLDPFQSEDHWIEQREQHLADAVAMVALHQANLHGHRVLEPDPREEPMQKIDTTIVGAGSRPQMQSQDFVAPSALPMNATPGVAFTATDTITH